MRSLKTVPPAAANEIPPEVAPPAPSCAPPPVTPPKEGPAEFHKADDLEKVFRLQGFKQGQLVFVRIPFPRNTDDFVLAERNLSRIADDFGIGLLVFDETTDWNALVVDDRELFRIGLMRAPK